MLPVEWKELVLLPYCVRFDRSFLPVFACFICHPQTNTLILSLTQLANQATSSRQYQASYVAFVLTTQSHLQLAPLNVSVRKDSSAPPLILLHQPALVRRTQLLQLTFCSLEAGLSDLSCNSSHSSTHYPSWPRRHHPVSRGIATAVVEPAAGDRRPRWPHLQCAVWELWWGFVCTLWWEGPLWDRTYRP